MNGATPQTPKLEKIPFSTRWSEYQPIFISQTLLILFITLDYSLTNNLNHQLGLSFYPLAFITEFLTCLPLTPFYANIKRRYIILAIHFAVIATFLIFFAPILSAYYFLLFFYVTVAMYWYGWKGYFTSIGFVLFVSIIAFVFQIHAPYSAEIYHIISYFFILLVSSLYVAQLLLQNPISVDKKFLRSSATFEHIRLISLINSITDAVIATDKNGVITLYNGAALSLVNTNATVDNQPFNYFFKLYDDSNSPVDIIGAAARSGKVLERDDLHFVSNENQKVSLSISVAPIHTQLGPASDEGFIIVARDITAQKKLADERNEFIAVTSHELRTPIAITEATISTAISAANKQKLDANIIKYLNLAHNNIIFLGDLVQGLSIIDEAERDNLDILIHPLDPNKLIHEVANEYGSEADKAGLKLQIIESHKDQTLLSSDLYIKHILQNYLSNAIKYTKQGVITLEVRSGEHNEFVFSVADTGKGIPSSEKGAIFKKFYQGEDFWTRENSGTGLGLYIVLKLAGRIHGKVWFESELNKGSTFYLSVPPIGALPKDQSQVSREEVKDFAGSI